MHSIKLVHHIGSSAKRFVSCIGADETSPSTNAGRGGFVWSLLLALYFGAIALAAMWVHPDQRGREDWDQMAQFSEACRISIQEYGEFPWWNPWNSGGMPLATHPACSIQSLVPIGSDTWQQLKIVLAIHMLLGIAGAHALTWSITRLPLAALTSGVVYGLNGAAISYASAGHLSVECSAYFPWAVLFLRWSRHSGAWGFGVGLCLAVSLLLYMHYFSVYTFLIVGGLGFAWMIDGSKFQRRQLLFAGLAAAAVVVALAGNRILLGGQLILENPRGKAGLDEMRTDYSPSQWAALFVRPGIWPDPITDKDPGVSHEANTYVGLPAILFFFLSLRKGWRWWHSLTFVSMLLAVGNSHWYHPSVWLEPLPIFSSMRVVTRWRLAAMLGLAIGSGVGVASIDKRWLRRGVFLVVFAIPLDLSYQGYAIFDRTFVIAPQEIAKSPIENRIVQFLNVEQIDGVEVPPGCNSTLYPFTASGRGVVAGYEPFVAVNQRLRGANGVGHPFYVGEFGPADVVRQTHWSPNRIVLEGPPGTNAWVNQNRGSYWCINGEPFKDPLPVVDRTEKITVTIPSSGVVELTVVPPLARLGWTLQALGAALAVVLIVFRRLPQRRVQR